ncbi:MAG: 50S ribosomal protein L31 [Gammaproteobacteria bacterium]|nr:50S ribosomal protein L31 [Gammaproteobacteria bacterium]
MKKELHPKYQLIKATCSCGNVMEVNSTLSKDISVEICSKCHPFYTGQQKIVDTGGRVQRFEKKFGKTS